MQKTLKPFSAACQLAYLFFMPNAVLINSEDLLIIRIMKSPILMVSLITNTIIHELLMVLAVMIALMQTVGYAVTTLLFLVEESILFVISVLGSICCGKKRSGGMVFGRTRLACNDFTDGVQSIAWSFASLVQTPIQVIVKFMQYIITGQWDGCYPLVESISLMGATFISSYLWSKVSKGVAISKKILDSNPNEKKLLSIMSADINKKIPRNSSAYASKDEEDLVDGKTLTALFEGGLAALAYNGLNDMKKYPEDCRVQWLPNQLTDAVRIYCKDKRAIAYQMYFAKLLEGLKQANQDGGEYKPLKDQLELVLRENCAKVLRNTVFSQAGKLDAIKTVPTAYKPLA